MNQVVAICALVTTRCSHFNELLTGAEGIILLKNVALKFALYCSLSAYAKALFLLSDTDAPTLFIHGCHSKNCQ